MKTKKGATLVGSLIAITILSTAFVSLLNLQSSIIKTRFFLKNDNTANLLTSEGVEIIRALYNNGDDLSTGSYAVDYNTTKSSIATTGCSIINIIDTCALILDDNLGYKLDTKGKTFYRFIDINVDGNITKVKSTVIVKNPRGPERVYQAISELYKIN